MKLVKLINKYDHKINYRYEKNAYSCLMFTLQLSGIYARYIFHQNKENKNGYDIANRKRVYNRILIHKKEGI